MLRLNPPSGRITTLVDEGGGAPLTFCSNAVAAADGTIYFTESTSRFRFEHWRAAILEQRGTGRLLRRTPDGQVAVCSTGCGSPTASSSHRTVTASWSQRRVRTA